MMPTERPVPATDWSGRRRPRPASGSTHSRPPEMPPWVKADWLPGQSRCGLRQPSACRTSRSTPSSEVCGHALGLVPSHLVDGRLRQHAGAGCQRHRGQQGRASAQQIRRACRRGRRRAAAPQARKRSSTSCTSRLSTPKPRTGMTRARRGRPSKVVSVIPRGSEQARCQGLVEGQTAEPRHQLGEQDEGHRVVGVGGCRVASRARWRSRTSSER